MISNPSLVPSPFPLSLRKNSPGLGIPDDQSFMEFFQSEHPVEIEIGCGKGKFLFETALQKPGTFFLGLDRVGKWMKRRQQAIEKRRLENIRLFKAEIREFLKVIPSGRVSVFHIYFPDPWPKRRHRKRRLINVEFLRSLYERLHSGGRIQAATDDEDYFKEIRKSAMTCGVSWSGLREAVNQKLGDMPIRTNYEIRYEAAGKPLFYLEMVK